MKAFSFEAEQLARCSELRDARVQIGRIDGAVGVGIDVRCVYLVEPAFRVRLRAGVARIGVHIETIHLSRKCDAARIVSDA